MMFKPPPKGVDGPAKESDSGANLARSKVYDSTKAPPPALVAASSGVGTAQKAPQTAL